MTRNPRPAADDARRPPGKPTGGRLGLVASLRAGAERLPPALRARQTRYLAAAQNGDGGFSGRRGASDCYYTAFGVAAGLMLGSLDAQRTGRAAGFLAAQLGRPQSGVDSIALLVAAAMIEAAGGPSPFASARVDRAEVLGTALGPLRRRGGWAKTPQGGQASTYQTFLAVLGHQLADLPVEAAREIAATLAARQRDDGGFVELDVMRHSGTNPTAAAVGALELLGALEPPAADRAAAFLAGMQAPEGGLRAHTRIPVADLLSTFTGLAALAGLGNPASLDHAAARRFVAAIEPPEGGFRGGPWDETADVEYTFYGLGCLALLDARDRSSEH